MFTVVASFAATLGLVTFAFTELLGSDGIAFDLVLLAFIFLVALGVDYNIFLMTRAREEAAVHGTREGILIALESTGTVVTGAGLILAGTFATLTLLPLEAAGPDRRHRRDRRPARHLRRPLAADPGDHVPVRRARLVAGSSALSQGAAPWITSRPALSSITQKPPAARARRWTRP